MFVVAVVHSLVSQIGLRLYYFDNFGHIKDIYSSLHVWRLPKLSQPITIFFSWGALGLLMTGPTPFISVAILCQHSSTVSDFLMDECLTEPDHILIPFEEIHKCIEFVERKIVRKTYIPMLLCKNVVYYCYPCCRYYELLECCVCCVCVGGGGGGYMLSTEHVSRHEFHSFRFVLFRYATYVIGSCI